MNDRTLDNQFSSGANPLSPEQLRQMQNIAALIGQGLNNNLGLLGNNLNLLNPMALQNLLNPRLANPGASNSTSSSSTSAAAAVAASSTATTTTGTSSRHQQRQQQQQQQQHHQQQQQQQSQQQQLIQHELTQRLHQQLQQIVQQSQRSPQSSHSTPASLNASGTETASLSIRQQQALQNSIPGLPGAVDQQKRKRGRPPWPQSHPSPASLGGGVGAETASLSIRQQQSLQNTLAGLPGAVASVTDQQKRKRGRPPLSAPSTSAGVPGGPAGVDYSMLNMLAAVKSQQDRDRLQRESKMQQQQREMRLQQERERQRELRLAQERAERQRELRVLQERERQRLEVERQRKAHHRLALQDIDRERRRQHMIMVRNLDAYKRNEEREKTMTAMMAEREKQMERRMYQKRLEVELIKDIRKPVDDMMLKNQKPLATLNRIPGLKLPGKAFADLLMSYEFLYNFGETVGLEPKEIPDINTLQLGLLNLNTWAENQFISTLHHLCMFAVKDPRFPYTGSTKEIENLDRTNEGLSQLLHFYLQVVTLNAKTDMEHEYRLYKLIEQKYFLSLNATQKAEMLAFICNELLCSHTVTKQMEDTIENVAKLRKDKWVLENELRKYRAVKTKRELKEEAGQKAKEAAAALNGNDLERLDEDGKINDSKDQINSEINDKEDNEDKTNKHSLTNGSSLIDGTPNKRENDNDTSTIPPNNTADLDDLEPGMTNDELNKKIENLTRQYNKTSNKLERAINSMRANPLGQDRFRRRYWVLPQVGGVFVEGMESSEPEELENNKFTEEELIEYEKEEQALNEQLAINNTESTSGEEDPEKVGIKEEKDDDEMDGIKEEVEGDIKDEDEPMEVKDEGIVGDSTEIKEEPKEVESTENGAGEEVKPELAVVNDNAEEANTIQVPTTPWFSILPRTSCDFTRPAPPPQPAEPENTSADEQQVTAPAEAESESAQQKKVSGDEQDGGTETKAELTCEELRAMRHEICPALAKRLEELEAEQYEVPRKIHPQYQCGWWRITDAQQLKAILSVLHERGSRERILHKHLTKHFQYACNSCKNTTVDFEITSYDRQLAGKNYGAPMPHADDDSADDLKDGDEEEEDEEGVDEIDEETGDDKAIQQAASAPIKKSKRKKASKSARARRLRARAAARKKVENSKNKVQR